MLSLGVVRALGSLLAITLLLAVTVAGGCEAQHLVAGSNAASPDGSAGAAMSPAGGQTGGLDGTGGLPGTGGGMVDASSNHGTGGSDGDMLLPGCPATSRTRYPLPTSLGFSPWFMAAGANENEAWFTFSAYVAAAQTDTARIGKISVTGDFTAFDLSIVAAVNSLVAGNQSDVWFTETADALGRIGHVDGLGVVTEFPIPTPNSDPDSIVLGTDGNLWFAETGVSNRIGRMSPEGVFTEFSIPTAVPGATTFAQHLAVSKSGTLFLLTTENGLYSVTPEGVMTWIPMSGIGVPAGLAIGADQALYLLENTTYDLIRFDFVASVPMLTQVIVVPTDSIGIAASPDGSMWLNTGNDLIRSVDGKLTDYQACDTEYSSGMAVAPSGAIWYSDTRGAAITRLVP